MICTDELCNYNMPLTLELHFEELRENYTSARELHSLWVMMKKQIEDEIIHSRNVFANYSLHDVSHSRSIIQAIERFLGEERIRRLSATDTFMLLICAYAHDYGMAQTFNRIYNILGSDRFRGFLEEMDKNRHNLEKEDAWAVRNLLNYLNDIKPKCPLEDMYLSIMLVAQMYLRPLHWKGVEDIWEDFQGLFQGYVKNRFIRGSEGIVEICKCHGQPMDSVFKLSLRTDGMVGDEFHPRFIAAMLRLGDLLDLDNGRFPLWFVREVARRQNLIPKLSVMHFLKHEAISHLLITHKKIEIRADCDSGQDGYEVASLVSEWTDWLTEECRQLVASWNEIAQPDFGRPPIFYQTIKIEADGSIEKGEKRCQRKSYFCSLGTQKTGSPKYIFGQAIQTFLKDKESFCFVDNMAYFWDRESNRCYHLTVRPCTIKERDGGNQVYLPETVRNLYRVSYKFNPISDSDTIYSRANRYGRLHAGFLDWNILILDDNPAKYLNIDRDSLRDGAICEEELLNVCRAILEKWCDWFCGQEKNKSRFKQIPGTLLSLALLFYQNIPLNRFMEFITPYREYLENLSYVIGDDRIPFTCLWDADRLFRACLELPGSFTNIESDTDEGEITDVELDLVKHLPHRLVHIEAILHRDSKLYYHFRLHRPGGDVNSIFMSGAARLYDYMRAFDSHADQKEHVEYPSIQKKVFKPNARFPHLLLPCYPHTFQKGSNMTASLDYCICWYILSPFDKSTANILKDGMKNHIQNEKEKKYELTEAVMASQQMNKCIRYIMKQRYSMVTERLKAEEAIMREYREFLEDFWDLLYKNREAVNNQFQEKQPVSEQGGEPWTLT